MTDQIETTPHTTVVVTAPKSVAAAFLLAFLFGPLGLLYASISGGLVMLLISVFVVVPTGGLAALVIWPASLIWAVLAAQASKATPTDAS